MDFTLPISLINWLLLAALIAITTLTAFSFKPAMNYLKLHLHGKAFDTLRNWAYTYVAALAQDPSLRGLASEEKKQQAMLWLVIQAEKLGITLSEAEASNLVEEAVYLVKNVGLKNLEEALANPIMALPNS
ncbi:MAG TPA: phage holin, LLH family [Anaerolineales bacterium]|nr:phage holin, LLH family [Anaerolineales bacterium]